MPQAFMPSPPGPVYFAPDIAGAMRSRRQESAYGRRTGIMEAENVFKRESTQAKIKREQDEADRERTEKEQEQMILQDFRIGVAGGIDFKSPSVRALHDADKTPDKSQFMRVAGSALKMTSQKQDRVWMTGPKGERKGQFLPTELETQTAAGWTRGQPVTKPKPGAMKTYKLPDGKPVTIPANQLPPEGAVPWQGKGSTFYGESGRKIADLYGGADIAAPVETSLQKDIIEAGDETVKMKKILTGFKRKYQTLLFRGKAKWEEYRQKLLGKDPDPVMGEALREFGTWYKGAQSLWAVGVQKLGKGNMTKMEKKMYGPTLPDPGMGLIPGDAPDVYFDALVERVEAMGAMTARRNYYLNPRGKGLTEAQYKDLVEKGKVPTVAEMDDLIKEKIAELQKEAEKKPDASDGEVAMAITSGLIELFGAVF